MRQKQMCAAVSNQPEPLRKNTSWSPAIDSIAAGAAIAGSALGLRSRGEKPWPELEAEPTSAPPDLGLLLFVDDTDRRVSQHGRLSEERSSRLGYTWESVQPPSLVEWVYRCTPRRSDKKSTRGDASITSTIGPSMDMTTISEATRSHVPENCKRAATATPSTTAGSTRVPSRASPEEFTSNVFPRPPSRQRPKASPRRPRSSMGIPESAISSNTIPKRPQTSMGISSSRISKSFPSEAIQSRPQSSLGFSHGEHAEAITAPPRPKSSIGMCSDVHQRTDGTYSALRCESACDEEDSENSKVPRAGSCGVETSGLAGAQSRAERLAAAAEEAGAKARGEVTLAIRARSICRLAGNAASRNLLHLWGDWDCPPESILQGDGTTKTKDKIERTNSNNANDGENRKPAARPSNTSGRYNLSPLGSIFEETAPRKRSIKVAENTALGRMVLEDPEKAAKYDLVTIPAWQLNKPWPPPPIGQRQLIRQAAEHSRAKAFEMEAEKIARMERAESRRILMKKRVAKLQVITSLVGLGLQARKSRERASTKPEDLEVCSTTDNKESVVNTSEVADLDSASTILDWAEKEAYRAIFNRFSKHDDYKLSRRGMIKAMREAGLTPNSQEEQRRFAAVQEQVILSTRGEFDEHPESNPLTCPQGRWEMSEFLLVCAALREISLRKLRKSNQEAADEFDVPLAEVEELRKIFHQHDPDSSGTIRAKDLKELLMVIDVKTSEEDFHLLLQSAGLQKEIFDFQEFLKLLKSLETVMQSPAMAPPSSPNKTMKKSLSTKSIGSLVSKKSLGALSPRQRMR